MEFVGCSWKLSVVQMLYNSVEVTNEYSPIVRSIKELMHRSWHITINHIYIESGEFCSGLPSELLL